MIPILPYVERGVKFIGDLVYLLQCPEYNGSVPNLFSPHAVLNTVFLLLVHDKNVYSMCRLHNPVPGDGPRVPCFPYGNNMVRVMSQESYGESEVSGVTW